MCTVVAHTGQSSQLFPEADSHAGFFQHLREHSSQASTSRTCVYFEMVFETPFGNFGIQANRLQLY
jgi:hypothetical protein